MTISAEDGLARLKMPKIRVFRPKTQVKFIYLMTRYGRLQAYLIAELSFDFSTGQPCHDQ